MVRKIKKKTLFFAGLVGLSLLSLFGMRSGSQGNAFTETDLKDLLAKTPTAHADVYPSPSPTSDPCPSGPCPGPGPMGLDDRSGGGSFL
jgi:hypothetical protein